MQTSTPLRRMPPALSPPPRHPCAVAVSGRGGRVGLEAELSGGFGDAVDEDALVLVVAVFAHDGAELGQVASRECARMRALHPQMHLAHTTVHITSERLSIVVRCCTLPERVESLPIRMHGGGYVRTVLYRGAVRARRRQLGQVVSALSFIGPRLNLLIADGFSVNKTITHMTPPFALRGENVPGEG